MILFTLRDTFIEMDYAMNMLMWIGFNKNLPPTEKLKQRPLWTGK